MRVIQDSDDDLDSDSDSPLQSPNVKIATTDGSSGDSPSFMSIDALAHFQLNQIHSRKISKPPVAISCNPLWTPHPPLGTHIATLRKLSTLIGVREGKPLQICTAQVRAVKSLLVGGRQAPLQSKPALTRSMHVTILVSHPWTRGIDIAIGFYRIL
jgi:hypothetical protein